MGRGVFARSARFLHNKPLPTTLTAYAVQILGAEMSAVRPTATSTNAVGYGRFTSSPAGRSAQIAVTPDDIANRSLGAFRPSGSLGV
jgi:hypothetical protein